ncbi:MAG: two-component response regulator [Methanoregula sp. PtaU1.Bin051]|nr:MAG: two-component response regulator [Methanoregula sp. PtaU1.Bin051]
MKPASILIVEDDFIVARTLEKTLSELGYHVAGMASTGQDALVMTREHQPSLVLLDIHLGDTMDGIETAQMIHEQHHIPVVYLTAYSDDQTFNRAIGTSLYGYLIKPVTLNALRTTIEVALEKFRIEKSLRQANRKLNLLSSITRHDIINTLTALMTAVDLAKMNATDPAFLEHIERESLLLAQIYRQIEFTRDYETLGTDAPVWNPVQTLVESTARQILPPEIKVVAPVQDVRIFADPLFEKVIYNLMDNAIRHNRNVTTIRFDSEERDDGLILICEDDGVGIPPEEKEKIFDRGYGKNTGLGLFLVREILGITGISITETGTPGKGARFEIRVPTGMYRM